MGLLDIHWHDSEVRKIIELRGADKSQLLFEVDYPIDWENQVYGVHTICFSSLATYEIHEGNVEGTTTLLDANKTLREDEIGINTIRIETTAGYRVVRCGSISLVKGRVSF